MDVTCERCSTEYEFDDALVSERGTTVKCTNCGYQFKVRRAEGSLPEKWVVRTVDGRELEFKMLRELQAAIAQAEIKRDDVISRGTTRPRRLGSIAELEPFFASPGSMLMSGTANGLGGPEPPGRPRSLTPQGLGGPQPGGTTEGSVVIPLPRSEDFQGRTPRSALDSASGSSSDSGTAMRDARQGEVAQARASSAVVTPASPAPDTGHLARGTVASGALPGVVVPPEEAPPLPDGFAGRKRAAGAERRQGSSRAAKDGSPNSRTLPAGLSPLSAPSEEAPSRVEIVSAPSLADKGDDAKGGPQLRRLAGERVTRRPTVAPALQTPPPSEPRASYFEDGYGDPRFNALVPSRRIGVARWIVGLIALGLAALAVVTLGSKYLSTPAPSRAQTSDERIPTLLGEGERSLAEGDLETARDKLVKASALAEDDPRVAGSLARLETVSADARWLRVQLLPPDDPDLDVATQELKSAVDRAQKATEHARQLAPTDAGVTRAAIDLLRIKGDLGGARKLVGAISAASAQSENALTLAALDLAEAQPSWAAVIERLRMAASSEKSLGRARALLIYALARAGDFAGARAEHGRLVAMSRPHPLARALLVFIDRLEKALGKPTGSAVTANPAASAGAGIRVEPRLPLPEAVEAPPPADPPRGARPPEPSQEGRVPDDYVAPGGTIDTSDLPGLHPVPAPKPAPSPPPTKEPSAVDPSASDLTGVTP